MSQPSITKICLKITCLKFHSNFPGANELMNEEPGWRHTHACLFHPQYIIAPLITPPIQHTRSFYQYISSMHLSIRFQRSYIFVDFCSRMKSDFSKTLELFKLAVEIYDTVVANTVIAWWQSAAKPLPEPMTTMFLGQYMFSRTTV